MIDHARMPVENDIDVARQLLRRLALDENAKAFVLRNRALYSVLLQAASPYIAGESREDAIRTAARLTADGHRVTIDFMGESTRDRQAAIVSAKEFSFLAQDLDGARLDASISLDVSHLGLIVDSQLGTEQLARLAGQLALSGREIIVSAEGADRTDMVLASVLGVLQGHSNVGFTVQAYLPRSSKDVRKVMNLGLKPVKIRVVKGAFDPPPGALSRGPDLNRAYLDLIDQIAAAGVCVSVGTHDVEIQDRVAEKIETGQIDRRLVEFECLLGISPDALDRLRDRGFATRVYVTYGKEWFLYLCNRLAEHPPSLIAAFNRVAGLFIHN